MGSLKEFFASEFANINGHIDGQFAELEARPVFRSRSPVGVSGYHDVLLGDNVRRCDFSCGNGKEGPSGVGRIHQSDVVGAHHCNEFLEKVGETSRGEQGYYSTGYLHSSRLMPLQCNSDSERFGDVSHHVDPSEYVSNNVMVENNRLALEDLLADFGILSRQGKVVSLMPNEFVIRDNRKMKVSLV